MTRITMTTTIIRGMTVVNKKIIGNYITVLVRTYVTRGMSRALNILRATFSKVFCTV